MHLLASFSMTDHGYQLTGLLGTTNWSKVIGGICYSTDKYQHVLLVHAKLGSGLKGGVTRGDCKCSVLKTVLYCWSRFPHASCVKKSNCK